jgi:spore germination cell wall hydrolase CwlJ-like protein
MFGDDFMLALCMWREARGEGTEGMTAVGCVVRNRMTKHGSSYYAEIIKPWQFSSISVKNDAEVNLFPATADTQWVASQELAKSIIAGVTVDNTSGAEFYYATTIPLPQWATSMTMTCQIGKQRFYKK